MDSKLRWCAALVASLALLACNRGQPPCSSAQYYDEALRACVGRMCASGTNPTHPDCLDGGSTDASDSGWSSEHEADAGARPQDAFDEDASVSLDALLEPPRPIAPLSTTIVSSKQPTLRWQLSASSDGAVIELSRARDFSTPSLVLRVAGDRVRPPSQLAAGVWFWRMRGRASSRNAEGTNSSPTWLFRVGTRSADDDRDTSWGNELDVNGDGFSDIAIAATGADNGRGRVDVYYGSAAGVGTTASATLRGSEPGASFGTAIGSAGDVNGDGFGDLIVGAPQSSPGGRMGAGSVQIFLGSASGIATTASIVLDGPLASSQFGAAVQGVGDVNADGRADIAVGAPLATPAGRTEAGTVAVFAGNATSVTATPLRVLEGTSPREHFGSAVAGGGDINGDGVADIAVGSAAAEPMGRVQAGAISVFHGSATGPTSVADRTIAGATALDNFGCAVSMGGDVNGDGYSDVVVGACGASPAGITRAGQALLFLGTAGGLASSSAGALNGQETSDQFGSSVRLSSDINADGYSDIVVGAPEAGLGDRGALFVFHGGPMGGPMTFAARVDNPTIDGHLPSALSCPGDANGDGFADVVAGNFAAAPGSRSLSGMVMILFGSSRGLQTAPARTLEA